MIEWKCIYTRNVQLRATCTLLNYFYFCTLGIHSCILQTTTLSSTRLPSYWADSLRSTVAHFKMNVLNEMLNAYMRLTFSFYIWWNICHCCYLKTFKDLYYRGLLCCGKNNFQETGLRDPCRFKGANTASQSSGHSIRLCFQCNNINHMYTTATQTYSFF